MNVTMFLNSEKKLNLVIFLALHLSRCFSARIILVGSIINNILGLTGHSFIHAKEKPSFEDVQRVKSIKERFEELKKR